MLRTLLSAIFSLLIVNAYPQKTMVSVMRTHQASKASWQILDNNYYPVFTGDYFNTDTTFFSLEANTRFYFQVSVSDVAENDSSLFALSVDNEALILVKSDILPGDHFFPFYTGIRADSTAKITGGSDADISDFPWQVYLRTSTFSCGGSIIDNQWIITAAHCVENDNNVILPASDFTVTVGANNPRIALEGKKYYVSNVIVHENYDPNTLNNDIALLRLKEAINYTNAEPIKIISRGDAENGATDPGVYSWISGYGLTSVSPDVYPTILQKATIPIVSNAQASTVWPDIPETDLMAGFRSITRDACSGDSGGPLVVPVNNGYKLAGIVSWGSNKCNTYGGYTRLSLFESWITGKTGIEITFSAPVPAGDSIVCPGTGSSDYRVSAVTNATAYNWSIVPSTAGTISSRNESATITWNSGFFGKAHIKLQVERTNEISEISELVVTLAMQTRIADQPAEIEACAEKPITLVIDPEGYNLHYKWYKNNTLITSEIANEFEISSASIYDSGNYYCQITGACGSVVSDIINLTVRPVTRITYFTPDTVVNFGDDLSLRVNSEGHNLQYQWYKESTSLEGETEPEIIIKNTDANAIGLYAVKVSGTCGTETSDNIYVFIKREGSSTETGLYIWPTLVENSFNIALNDDRKYNILIFSTSGRLIREVLNAEYETTISTGNLPAGIYIVTVYNSDFRKSVKIIKK